MQRVFEQIWAWLQTGVIQLSDNGWGDAAPAAIRCMSSYARMLLPTLSPAPPGLPQFEPLGSIELKPIIVQVERRYTQYRSLAAIPIAVADMFRT